MEKNPITDERKRIYVLRIAGYSFVASALTFLVAVLISTEPDFDQEKLVVPDTLLALGQLWTCLLIIGCVAYATLLAETKDTLNSIGFTLMSVTQGIVFVLYVISYSGDEKFDEAYRMFAASLYLWVASGLMIAFFSDFPKWIKILGVISCLPYVAENLIYRIEGGRSGILLLLDGIGNILFNATVLCWGLVLLYQLRAERKEVAG